MSLTAAAYEYVRQLAERESALSLGDGKAYLVEARLAGIAQRESCSSVSELIAVMPRRSAALRDDVVEALTTNETSFFRDVHPFEALRDVLLPGALAARGRASVWCAAASTGQEPYSVAMVAADSFPNAEVSILATDLSRDVLGRAEQGVFSQLEVNRGLPAAKLVRHFERVGLRWRVKEDIRRRVRFRQLNLARTWPELPRMDVILLRNVLIYFDAAAKRAVLARVRRVLAPDGALFLGTAETTYGLVEGWDRVYVNGASFYRPARTDERQP